MSVRGEHRKAAILPAAIDRLARLGFEGFRVRDVAQTSASAMTALWVAVAGSEIPWVMKLVVRPARRRRVAS